MIKKLAYEMEMSPRELRKCIIQGVVGAPFAILYVYIVFAVLGLAGGMW